MNPKPDTTQFWQATAIYLELAYNGSLNPAAERRIAQLRSASEDVLFRCEVFELNLPESPTRYSLRLGNRFYPHMKLVIELRPDRGGYLFRADTHDQHGCPDPDSADYEAYRTLMAMNLELSQKIESAWAEASIPTFKTFLRDDLARRMATAARTT